MQLLLLNILSRYDTLFGIECIASYKLIACEMELGKKERGNETRESLMTIGCVHVFHISYIRKIYFLNLSQIYQHVLSLVQLAASVVIVSNSI